MCTVLGREPAALPRQGRHDGAALKLPRVPPPRPSTAPPEGRASEPSLAELVEQRRSMANCGQPRLPPLRAYAAAASRMPLAQLLLSDPSHSAPSCAAANPAASRSRVGSKDSVFRSEAEGLAAVQAALQDAGEPIPAACKLVRQLLSSARQPGDRRQLRFVLDVLESVESAGGTVRHSDQVDLRLKSLEREDLEMDDGTRAYLAGFAQSTVRVKRRRTLRQVVQAMLFAQRLVRTSSPRAAGSSRMSQSMTAASSEGGAVGASLGELLDSLDSIQDFDIFAVADCAAWRPLKPVGLRILQQRRIFKEFVLSESKFRSFLDDVEDAYRDNPYHNALHAAEVAQTTHAFLLSSGTRWSELEMLSILVAAMVHDVGHPGVTNGFRISVADEDSVTYNDRSVNENMHSAMAFRIAQKQASNWSGSLSREQFTSMRKLMIDAVLSTDMAIHGEAQKSYRAAVEKFGDDAAKWDRPSLALEWLMHVADISSTTKPLGVAERWTDRLLEEFFAQGDRERELALPVSPLCDRKTVSRVSSQLGFVNFIVKPSFLALAETADVRDSLDNLEAYQVTYLERQAAEKREEESKAKDG